VYTIIKQKFPLISVCNGASQHFSKSAKQRTKA
jgi:hypothetical protein